MSYLIRRVLAKPRLILDEMCRLYAFLCKTRLIFPRTNGPNIKHCSFFESLMPEQNQNKPNYIEQNNQT